jgi:NAD(P)-dependent dehydrogenase (short-subunit alcohol dehydrogenase family)
MYWPSRKQCSTFLKIRSPASRFPNLFYLQRTFWILSLAVIFSDALVAFTLAVEVPKVPSNLNKIRLCSNAGILTADGIETPDGAWQRIRSVDVMVHIYAARAVLLHMLARSEGYLLQTVSAAGLLTILGSAAYAVTKHTSLTFTVWLAITYGERGIKVSAVCPMGVRTDMLKNDKSGPVASLADPVIELEQLAQAVIEGLAEERFLILPNQEVVHLLAFKRLMGKAPGVIAGKMWDAEPVASSAFPVPALHHRAHAMKAVRWAFMYGWTPLLRWPAPSIAERSRPSR